MNHRRGTLRIAALVFTLLLVGTMLAAPALAQQDTLTIVVRDRILTPLDSATIYIDGNLAGVTSAEGKLLLTSFPSGMHNVTAIKDGYSNKTVNKELLAGSDVVLEMVKKVGSSGAVTFQVLEDSVSQSKIAEASVYVDGKFVGLSGRGTGLLSVDIPDGMHEITVAKKGSLNITMNLDILQDNTYIILLKPGAKFSIYDLDLFFYALQKEIMYGAVNTLKLSVVAMAVGIVIGLIMGIGRTIDRPSWSMISGSIKKIPAEGLQGLLRSLKMFLLKIYGAISSIYVEGVRGLPLLLQLLFVNFGLPFLITDLTGSQFNIDAFTACIIALSVNSAAYMAEIFKAGILAIHKGQMEAARSLGMSYPQSMRYIILPQAFKIVLPALGNEFIALIKDSSIGLVISVSEILWWSKTVGAEAYNTFTPLLAAGVVYLCITIPLGRIVQWMETKYNVNTRKDGAGLLGMKRKQKPKLPEGTV